MNAIRTILLAMCAMVIFCMPVIAEDDNNDHIPITAETVQDIRQLATIEQEGSLSYRFSDSGRYLATTGAGRIINLWDMSQGLHLHQFDRGEGFGGFIIRDMRFFGNEEQVLMVITSDGSIAYWSFDDRNYSVKITYHEYGDSFGIAIHPSEPIWYFVEREGDLLVVDEGTNQIIERISWLDEEAYGIHVSPTENVVAVVTNNGTFGLWEIGAEQGQSVETYVEYLTRVNITNDGRLALTDAPSEVRVWDIITGETILLIDDYRSVEIPRISPDGSLIAGFVEGDMVFWDVATGDEIHRASTDFPYITMLEFSPDGTTLAFGTEYDGPMVLWGISALGYDEITLNNE